MRVAVRHTDSSHPNAHWFAFAEGRILGFTDPMSGRSYGPDEVAHALLGRAQDQFPAEQGYEHRIETLHVAGVDEKGNERSEWHPIGTSDLPRVGQGQVATQSLSAEQGQQAAVGNQPPAGDQGSVEG